MIYPYVCSKCNKSTDLIQSMMDEIKKEILCEHCGDIAHRCFGSNVIIPEHMKAHSETYNSDTAADFSYMSNKLKHSYPSGRDSKIYY